MDKVIAFVISNKNRLINQLYMRIFSERQIREIRLGLVEDLDVKCYAKSYFDERQMREIRYGLEEGLDVRSYAKRDYDSNKMRKIRLDLEKQYQ